MKRGDSKLITDHEQNLDEAVAAWDWKKESELMGVMIGGMDFKGLRGEMYAFEF